MVYDALTLMSSVGRGSGGEVVAKAGRVVASNACCEVVGVGVRVKGRTGPRRAGPTQRDTWPQPIRQHVAVLQQRSIVAAAAAAGGCDGRISGPSN